MMEINKKLNLVLFCSLGFFSYVSLAAQEQTSDVEAAKRRAIILRPMIGGVQGTLIFGVKNTAKKTEIYQADLLLPRDAEKVFLGGEGKVDGEIGTHPLNGQRFIKKNIDPGVTLITVKFQKKAEKNSLRLEFDSPEDIEKLSLMTPRRFGVKISSPQLETQVVPHFTGEELIGFQLKDTLKAGVTLEVEVENIPQPRDRYWYWAGGIFGVLIVGAVTEEFLARKRKK